MDRRSHAVFHAGGHEKGLRFCAHVSREVAPHCYNMRSSGGAVQLWICMLGSECCHRSYLLVLEFFLLSGRERRRQRHKDPTEKDTKPWNVHSHLPATSCSEARSASLTRPPLHLHYQYSTRMPGQKSPESHVNCEAVEFGRTYLVTKCAKMRPTHCNKYSIMCLVSESKSNYPALLQC